jgi:hypothetical protein
MGEAVQRVPILLVRTTRGSRRLLVCGPVTPEQLEGFAWTLETEFGYSLNVRM